MINKLCLKHTKKNFTCTKTVEQYTDLQWVTKETGQLTYEGS